MYSNSFSIIIPIHNESLNIITLIDEIIISLSKFNNYEIIIVDDFSKDNSFELIRENFNRDFIKVIRNNENIGQSLSIIKGCEICNYDTIVTLDGDGQNDPKDIPALLNTYFEEVDTELVSGIRKNRQDTYLKKITSKLANYIRSKILKDDCIDTGCALKVFNKNTFLKFPKFNGVHRFIPAFFKYYNKKIIFVNVNHRKRKFGNSNYDTVKRAFRGLNDTIRVYNIIRK